MTTLRLILCFCFLIGAAGAVIHFELFRHPVPVKTIRGSMKGLGNYNPDVRIDIYDNAEIWNESSLSFEERRKRQHKLASVSPNEKGEFTVKNLPKGYYEVEFRLYNGGWNVASLLVQVDPSKGTRDKFCVSLSQEGSGQASSIKKCE